MIVATLAEQLTQTLAAMRIVGIPFTVQPGQPVTATLAPPPAAMELTESVPGDVSLDFVAKDVVFSNANISDAGFVGDPALTKIKPLFNFTSVPPSVDPAGVGGLIGKIRGTIPIPIPVVAAPEIKVRWSVFNASDQEVSDYDAPSGRNGQAFDVIFIPEFRVFDGTFPAPSKRKISAKVTLTVGTTTVTATVGPLIVSVPSIPFPKVLVLSLHEHHQGPALIMVPGNSAITTINHVKSLLQPIRDSITTLTSIAAFAAPMLLGIEAVTGALENANLAFTKSDAVRNLNDIDMVTRAWFENDTEAEDELSSFVYLSPPPDREGDSNAVEMFNRQDFETGGGKFTVTTGDSFVALCSTLHTATPTVKPAGASLTVNHAPPSTLSQFFIIPGTFGDRLSSIRFL